MNRFSASIAHGSQSTASRFTASRLTAFKSIASRSTASKYSSNYDRSWRPTISPNMVNYGFYVHLWVHSILASKCISNLAPSRPPSASLSSLDRSVSYISKMCNGLEVITQRLSCSEQPHRSFQKLPEGSEQAECKRCASEVLWKYFRCSSTLLM